MTPDEIAKVDHVLVKDEIHVADFRYWSGVLSRLLDREVLPDEVWDWLLADEEPGEIGGYGHGV